MLSDLMKPAGSGSGLGLGLAPRRVGAVAKRAGVHLPGAAERLPLLKLGREDDGVAVWWIGVHGGAGESTLEEIFCGSRAAGHRWPVAPPGTPPVVVVLVARTDARGLRAAQSAMQQWQAGELGLLVVGLVLMADAPGRLPRALQHLASVIGGGVPRVWSFPWVESWRTGEVPSRSNSPKQAERLLADLRSVGALGGEAGV
jgi:acetyl-CoA acetyltransferase